MIALHFVGVDFEDNEEGGEVDGDTRLDGALCAHDNDDLMLVMLQGYDFINCNINNQ